MATYEVKSVVCDYGVYENGELKLILNSHLNALLIKDILEVDQSRPNNTTAYNCDCYVRFADYLKKGDAE